MNCVIPILYLVNSIHPGHIENNDIAQSICFYSKKRNLDPFNVAAIIAHESGFSYKLRSRTSDIGLMQINEKYIQAKCNPMKINCNIKIGTKRLATIKNAGDLYGYHWMRRYNWNSKKHYLRVLWIAEAFRKIVIGHSYLIRYIKTRRYQRLKITLMCIKEDLCGQLRMDV